MYHEYNQTQLEQLAAYSFRDTSQVRFLICGPDRCPMLLRSLAGQLHQNYIFVSYSDAASHSDTKFDAVVLVGEDAAFAYTALSAFAEAILHGSDLVFCDAAFGPAGMTSCYRTRSNAVGTVAALSAGLFRSLSWDSLPRMLYLAGKCAEQPTHISQMLLQYRRPVLESDVWETTTEQKRALVLSNEFSMTGAPIVLSNAVQTLIGMGVQVVVASAQHGRAAELFLDAGAVVLVSSDMSLEGELGSLAYHSDLVFVNTAALADAICVLNGAPLPVIWWIHEAVFLYHGLECHLPARLQPNIHAFAVGDYAAGAISRVRNTIRPEILLYTLPDYTKNGKTEVALPFDPRLPFFLNVGAVGNKKGQDVLVQAIHLLPASVREKAAFLFVGTAADEQVADAVRTLAAEAPDHVHYIPALSREEILYVTERCFCTVCASRDDTMPTVITEGFIFGKPTIVSAHTGTASLVQEGVHGFVYTDDDPRRLAQYLEQAIENTDTMRGMHDACRQLYQDYFSQQRFEQRLRASVAEMMNGESFHGPIR